VGRGPGEGGLSIVGTFTFTAPVSLDAPRAKVSVVGLLEEVVGRGDSLEGVPIALRAQSRNNATTAVFETVLGQIPRIRMTIRAQSAGRFAFRIEVSGGTIRVPEACSPVALTTAFVIDDGVNRPVAVAGEEPWGCFGTGNRYMRSP
jgi:hypothetical protein